MDTQEKLYLKCSLCNNTHHYSFSEEEIQALEVEWKSSGIDSFLLEHSPIEGKEYIIRLDPPLTIDLNNYLWGVYLSPNSFLNGIETEADIIDIRFCKCEVLEVVKKLDNTAFLKVKVERVVEINDIKSYKNPKSEWFSLLQDESTFKRHGFIENFKKYSYIEIAIQGDLGINAIIKKENNKSEIVVINEWDFHLNRWNLCSLPIDKEEEKKYGVQYDR